MKLKRNIDEFLLRWSKTNDDSSTTKPIVLEGVNYVGKTTTIINFFEENNLLYLYFDLSKNREIKEVIKNLNIDTLIEYLQDKWNFVIGKTFLFFDNSEYCLEIIEMLKHFNQYYPSIKIIISGDLLSIKLGTKSENRIIFPVGKIITVTLNPLSFEEFVLNVDKNFNNNIVDCLKTYNLSALNLIYKDKLLDLYWDYLMVGGMSESVVDYISEKDIDFLNQKIKDIKNKYVSYIKNTYKNKTQQIKALSIFESIHKQNNRVNNKFSFRWLDIENKNNCNNRFRDFELVYSKLKISKMINAIEYLDELKIPLIDFANPSKFKIYYSVVSFYTSIYNFNKTKVINNKEEWDYIKGGVTKNFVNNELIHSDNFISTRFSKLYTYSKNNVNENIELDFLIENPIVNPIVLEVKSSKNIKAKSFQKINDLKPNWNFILCSLNDLEIKNKYLSIPIYLIGYFHKYVINSKNHQLVKQYGLKSFYDNK